MEERKLVHWADITAHRLSKQLGHKNQYVLASGITPSGDVHFGNFRETITVDFVAKALKDLGKNVRFIFSWDDYDTLRKIPANFPKQELLEKYMFHPIVDVPDPYEKDESYADHNEKSYMNQIKKLGIEVEPLYQAKKYKSGEYNQEILKALMNTEKIKGILNKYRKTPLTEDWLPLNIYCQSCNRDNDIKMSFDGKKTVHYHCKSCQKDFSEDVLSSKRLKLPWRIDWPMRWAYEQVDFEPGGKDHSSQGGSYSTAKEIVGEVFDFQAPIYLQYDFVSIKGGPGKMSSSSGNVVTVDDVLKIYSPQMIRWIFASYKTNVDFSVSFDADVIKTYEDYDRFLALAFSEGNDDNKKVQMAKRVFELSEIDEYPIKNLPFRPSFRHLCNILQIHQGDISKSFKFYEKNITSAEDKLFFEERAKRAWNWLTIYAPDDFKFSLNNSKDPSFNHLSLNDEKRHFLSKMIQSLETNWQSSTTDSELHEQIYKLINEHQLNPGDVFPVIYESLISKVKGPKLASFILAIGKDKTLSIIKNALG